MQKIKVAVFFGGQSFEHDVSILTGIQALEVLDPTKYDAFPVFVEKDGSLWTGDYLISTSFYPITEIKKSKLIEVEISITKPSTTPKLKILHRFPFTKQYVDFDIALLAFHGGMGESGGFQGVFETSQIPYTGADILSSSVYMSKIATKRMCRAIDIPVLDEVVVKKPNTQDFINIDEIVNLLNVKYPLCAKPANLGSSVGVHRVNDKSELSSALLDIFKMDEQAILEPFVENLVEYNIALIKGLDGKTLTSVIESPNSNGKHLSFADKYLSETGAKKKGLSLSAMPSQSLIESRRIFNPKIDAKLKQIIINAGTKIFEAMGQTGNPRIDFLSNEKTGDIWLNEVNPIPGSFAFYLWEQSDLKINYTKLLDIIITNGLNNFKLKKHLVNLQTSASVIFKDR